MILYMIHNSVNGKYYVGKTTQTLCLRWAQHRYNARRGVITHLYNAMRKYGVGNFKINVLMTLQTEDELNRWEQELIQMFRANKRETGYNLTVGGEGVMHGRTHSAETKRKMSLTRKGKKLPPRTAEWRAKHSALGKARTGAKNPFFGKSHSEESIQKMREASTGQVHSKEMRAKHAAATKAMWQDPEFKERMSVKRKAMWQDPDFRAKVREGRCGGGALLLG